MYLHFEKEEEDDQLLYHYKKTAGEAMPTKSGVHELDINPYLHKFFELVPID